MSDQNRPLALHIQQRQILKYFPNFLACFLLITRSSLTIAEIKPFDGLIIPTKSLSDLEIVKMS